MMQPIASDDVAAAVVDVALAEPLNSTIELAGPEPIRQDELVRQFLSATGDSTDGNHRSQSPVFRRRRSMTKVSRRTKILAWDPRASANGSHAPRNNLSPQICPSGGRQRPESTLLRSGNKRPLTQRRGRRPHRRDSFRRLTEHLGPKVKSKKSTSRTPLMKTHSCFRLLTNALTGAILFTTAPFRQRQPMRLRSRIS